MPNTQRSELRSGTRREILKDRLGKIWDDSAIDKALDLAVEEVEARGNYKFPQNQTDATFNTVASQQEYDLETVAPEYQGIDLVQYDNVTLYPTTLEKLKRDYRDFIEGTPTHYYTYNGQLGLHPYPSTIKQVDITYKKVVSLGEADTAESPYPKAFDKAIELYAAYTCLAQPWDQKNLFSARTKLEQFKKEIAKLFNRFLLPDRENIIYRNNYIPRQARVSTYGRVTNPNNL